MFRSLPRIVSGYPKRHVLHTFRRIHGCNRIGNRDVVGHGINGCYNYKDDAHFPFPAVRFMENDPCICLLREKERGDWKCLSCEEKKALYRASFCQTFAEFQHPTGSWKFIVGWALIIVSGAFWAMTFYHLVVKDVTPDHITDPEKQAAQLRRMLELRVNPVDGLASKWDYLNDKWK